MGLNSTSVFDGFNVPVNEELENIVNEINSRGKDLGFRIVARIERGKIFLFQSIENKVQVAINNIGNFSDDHKEFPYVSELDNIKSLRSFVNYGLSPSMNWSFLDLDIYNFTSNVVEFISKDNLSPSDREYYLHTVEETTMYLHNYFTCLNLIRDVCLECKNNLITDPTKLDAPNMEEVSDSINDLCKSNKLIIGYAVLCNKEKVKLESSLASFSSKAIDTIKKISVHYESFPYVKELSSLEKHFKYLNGGGIDLSYDTNGMDIDGEVLVMDISSTLEFQPISQEVKDSILKYLDSISKYFVRFTKILNVINNVFSEHSKSINNPSLHEDKQLDKLRNSMLIDMEWILEDEDRIKEYCNFIENLKSKTNH